MNIRHFKLIAAVLTVGIIMLRSSIISNAQEWHWTQGILDEDLKYGDVNNDGVVGLGDAKELICLISGKYKMQRIHLSSGDINRDGRISVRDALLLLQNFAGLRDDGLGYEQALKNVTYEIPECFADGGEMLLYAEKPLSFFGADGYGKYTTGGRGGRVIFVTNLNDGGEGSFRAACEATGKRIIVFRVSGVIYLSKGISVNGDCTIAGETAPGDGITLANDTLQLKGNNIIVRYISVRPGDQSGKQPDGIDVKAISDVVVDHCSTSFGVDENLSIAAGSNEKGTAVCNRVSVQWCIISESITQSPNNGKRHGMGSIITSGYGGKISYHHNFLSDNSSRNPVVGSIDSNQTDTLGADYEIADNVIYNWMGDSATKSSSNDENGMYLHLSRFNLLNNYYRQGPGSTGTIMLSEGGNGSKAYIAGNMMNGIEYTDPSDCVVFTDDVLASAKNPYYQVHGEYLTPEKYFMKERFADSELVHLQTAETAKNDILKYVGNSLSRDTFDSSCLEQFEKKEGGFINQTFESAGWIYGSPVHKVGTLYWQEIQGQYPKRASYPPYGDSDRDGMSDDWEDFMHLDKNNPGDGAAAYRGTAYTNLDVFLQFLVEHPDAAIAR